MAEAGLRRRVMGAVATGAFSLCAFAQARGGADAEWESYRAHVAAASAFLELGQPARAREWLAGAPEVQRGWEWRHLSSELDGSQGTVMISDAAVMGLAVSPDGARAACLNSKGQLALVNLADQTVVRSWDAHGAAGGFTVRFSPDGTKIASSGGDRLVKVWDSATGELLVTFDKHKFPVGGVAWSPDGKRIASSAYFMDKETPLEGRVHVWAATDGAIERTMVAGVKPIVCVDWSRDGKHIAAGSWDSEVVIWRAEDGGEVRRINEQPRPTSASQIDAVAISPDGSLLAYGSKRKWIRVHRIDTGEQVASLTSHDAEVSAVAFSADGAVLATAAGDDTIRLWDTKDWSEAVVLRGHDARARYLAFSPNGERLYSASLDKTVRAWDVSRRDHRGVRMKARSGNYSACFSPDGALVAGAGFDGGVRVWDSESGALAAEWNAHGKRPTCMTAWSPDGTRLATCSWDRTAHIYEMPSHELGHTLTHTDGVGFVTWSPDGNSVLTASNNRKAYLWDAKKGVLTGSLTGHTGAVNEARFNPAGTLVATASADRSSRIYAVASGETVATLKGHEGPVAACSWSPDGKMLATAGGDGTVRLWGADGASMGVAYSGDEPIHRVAFSPDGTRLAIGCTELIVIDPRRAGTAVRLTPHEGDIWHLAWSPDGKRLATACWDGTAAILESVPVRERAAGR